MKNNTYPEKLAVFVRDGLVEQEHFGFVVRANKERELEKIGDDKNYPFYLRSCAKPLQASLLIDYGLDKKFDLSDEEIAICCASHTGEKVHTDLVKGLLTKFGLDETYLKCGIHEPLSKTAQKNLIERKKLPSALHNNCSGKHAMMLGLCVLNGWDIKNYDDINHPLQQEIKRKINELCKITSDYPVTKDGCGVPIFSMPLLNMVKGYLNLFCDKRYERIKTAFLNNPYIIGGEDRTDTKIISQTDGIVAKVGAGGLCIVVDTKTEEGFVVKICDANMQAREVVTCDLIKNIHRGEISIDRDIKTLHGEIVGYISSVF